MTAVAVFLAVTAPGAAEGAAFGHALHSPDRYETRLAGAAQHGEAALRTLGDDVGIAAQRSGLSPGRLRHLLRTDPTAWVDPRGHVFFREPAPTASAGGRSASAQATPSASYPYAKTFQLHSRPQSTRTIYLNFTGGDVSRTAWGPSIGVVPPFSLDDNSGWSTQEQDLVQAVWSRVSALYAPLDVDVTTQDPGNAALAYAGPGDPAYGTMAMITDSGATAQAVCSGCGGLAYLGTFDWVDTSGQIPYYEPAFVLASRLGDTVAGIADAAAHEVGHNIGLSHDGRRNDAYDVGVGGWGPVMGAPYSMGLLQFSDGDYPGATNTEDDYAVAASHGVPLVTDDLPDTAATATPMTVGSGSDTATGLITTRADRDAVSFTTGCTGAVQLDLRPTGDHPGLDTSLRLLTTAGSELAAADPPMVGTGSFPTASATGLAAHLTRTLAPGTYVVQVDGTGFSNVTTSYSDYGSRGGWSLHVTGCVITPGTVPPSPPRTPDVSWDTTARTATLTWAPPADDGGSAVSRYVVGLGGQPGVTVDAATHTHTFSDLDGGVAYDFSVTATNAAGSSTPATVTSTAPAMPLAAPRTVALHHAWSGTAGRRITATARWAIPLTDGGSPILRYRIRALRLDDAGHVIHRRHFVAGAGHDSRRMRLQRGHWVFRVAAVNAVGMGHLSARSNEVTAR